MVNGKQFGKSIRHNLENVIDPFANNGDKVSVPLLLSLSILMCLSVSVPIVPDKNLGQKDKVLKLGYKECEGVLCYTNEFLCVSIFTLYYYYPL